MSLAYSEDNNKLNFFGIMDNARGYELHLKQLDQIYKVNAAKKSDGFNNLNERILRTRNVNRTAVRKGEIKEMKIQNSGVYTGLKKINNRTTQYPPYNYKMPTGISRFNYEQQRNLNNSDSKSQVSRKSKQSQRSVQTNKSRDSLKSMNSTQSKGSKTNSTSNGLKNNLMAKANLGSLKPTVNKPKAQTKPKADLNKSASSRNKLGMSRDNLMRDNISNRSRTNSVAKSKNASNLFQRTSTPSKNDPKFFFHSKKRNTEKQEIQLENKRLGNSIVRTQGAIPKTSD